MNKEELKMEVYMDVAKSLIMFFPFAAPWLMLLIMISINDSIVVFALTMVFVGVIVFGFLWAVCFRYLVKHFWNKQTTID